MDPTTPTTAGQPTGPVVLPAVQAAPRAAFQAVKEIQAIKPGYKTTEFWLTIVFNLVNGAVLLLPADSIAAKVAGLLVAALTVFGYSQSRGMAKSALQ